jgi:hypothetical protein
MEQTGDGFERGGFACAVRADQGHDLTSADLQADAFEHVGPATINF